MASGLEIRRRDASVSMYISCIFYEQTLDKF